MLTKAMIMAAGVGSRLGALTCTVPKPLVPLANVPAMDILANHLVSFGIKNIIANTFYKAEDLQNHYKFSKIDADFHFIRERELSGTAGGVKKCSFFFDKDQDFIVLSGDGLTDLNISDAYQSHKKSNAVATIVIKEVEHKEVSKYGIIVPDDKGFASTFQEKPLLNEAKSNLANTGIYIFNYKIFNFIPENTFFDFAKNVFPVIFNNGLKINTYKMSGYWSDIGSLEQYKQSNIDLIENKISSFRTEPITTKDAAYITGKNFQAGNGSKIKGYCTIGNNCKIGKNCVINNSILWDNIEVEDNIVIENSIVLSNTIISKSIFNDIAITSQEVYEKSKVSA